MAASVRAREVHGDKLQRVVAEAVAIHLKHFGLGTLVDFMLHWGHCQSVLI